MEVLAKFLFSNCLGIRATNIIKTKTNQIDCLINNDFLIKNTVYEDMGSIVHVECKNESKPPGNTYYNKLYAIISSSKHADENGLGIIFSRLPVSKDVELNVMYSYFLKDRIIIINFSDDDYRKLENGRNFLDLIKEKIHYIKSRITTKPEKHKLFY